MKNDPNYQALLEPEGRFFYLGANTTVPPLDNKMVRQALFYAVDRKRFVDTLSLGFGTPQSIPWPSFSPAYEASKANQYGFDLDKARSMLRAAGVTSMELDYYPVSLYPELKQFAEIQQADFAKIGVTINIKNIDLAAWITIVAGHQYNGLYSTAIGSAQLNPITLMSGAAYKDPGNNSAFVTPGVHAAAGSGRHRDRPRQAEAGLFTTQRLTCWIRRSSGRSPLRPSASRRARTCTTSASCCTTRSTSRSMWLS